MKMSFFILELLQNKYLTHFLFSSASTTLELRQTYWPHQRHHEKTHSLSTKLLNFHSFYAFSNFHFSIFYGLALVFCFPKHNVCVYIISHKIIWQLAQWYSDFGNWKYQCHKHMIRSSWDLGPSKNLNESHTCTQIYMIHNPLEKTQSYSFMQYISGFWTHCQPFTTDFQATFWTKLIILCGQS